jgi:hypothetical protein
MTGTIYKPGTSTQRELLVLLTFSLSLTVVLWGCAAEPNAEQANVVAEIKNLGGKVTIAKTSPGRPIIKVVLMKTMVTDDGLEQLKVLTQLQTLNLEDTKVTDDGLKYLKGLTQLQHLFLGGTMVTDAGLEHLKGLTQLQSLNLGGTKVTDQGAQKLRQALPNCTIAR